MVPFHVGPRTVRLGAYSWPTAAVVRARVVATGDRRLWRWGYAVVGAVGAVVSFVAASVVVLAVSIWRVQFSEAEALSRGATDLALGASAAGSVAIGGALYLLVRRQDRPMYAFVLDLADASSVRLGAGANRALLCEMADAVTAAVERRLVAPVELLVDERELGPWGVTSLHAGGA